MTSKLLTNFYCMYITSSHHITVCLWKVSTAHYNSQKVFRLLTTADNSSSPLQQQQQSRTTSSNSKKLVWTYLLLMGLAANLTSIGHSYQYYATKMILIKYEMEYEMS